LHYIIFNKMNRQEFETQLGLELPSSFETYTLETQELIVKYLNQLNPIERKAYIIGKNHLGTSFNVVKSNGFNEWKKKMR
jgi:hypothetical protein